MKSHDHSELRIDRDSKAHFRYRAPDAVRRLENKIAEIEGKIGNGLEARVRLIERMQWWQIGIMVAIIGALVGALWYLTTHTMDSNAEILRRVNEMLSKGGN
jgi:hypothetical protein